MPDLFPPSDTKTQRDIDDIQLRLDGMPTSEIGTVISYDNVSETGVCKLSTGQSIQFKNWTGVYLTENTKVFVLTKDSINYVVGTEETLSGWASTQVVVTRPSTETTMSLSNRDVGKLMITTRSTGEIQIPVNHNLALMPGQSIDFIRGNNAEVRFVQQLQVGGQPPSVAVVNATPGLRLQARWSAATLICTGANQYVLVGDLKT